MNAPTHHHYAAAASMDIHHVNLNRLVPFFANISSDAFYGTDVLTVPKAAIFHSRYCNNLPLQELRSGRKKVFGDDPLDFCSRTS
jgi:hypothetical protein